MQSSAAELEWLNLTAKYGKCLLPPMRYITSREKKRKALCKIVDNVSKDLFPLCVPCIMQTINMHKEVCEEYEDSEVQVDGILGWLPRMEEYRELLLEEVKQRRQKYGLKI